MQAAVFAVYRCGFYPKSALEQDNGVANRLDKIVKMINECRYGIHDISRTQLNSRGLPRFNMPFELGIFIGASRFGGTAQKRKSAVIFDKTPYRYQQFLSDINGFDPKAHNNTQVNILRQIRNWLSTESRRKNIPTAPILISEYRRFSRSLPGLLRTAGLHANTMTFGDLCVVIKNYLVTNNIISIA